MGAHLRYVDGAITNRVPWSLPEPLEKLAARFLPGLALMLRPQWKYNYAIISSDIGEIYQKVLREILPAEKIEDLFRGFPKNFHIISFPSIERTTALFHCDLGHEIGHLAAKRFFENEAKTSSFLIDLREKILAHETAGATSTSSLEELAQKLQRATRVR